MNEFLKNLRNPQRNPKPRHSAGTRKSAEGNFYPSIDRRKNTERRESQLSNFDDLPQEKDALSQAMHAIKPNLAAISASIERMCESGEKLAESQIKFHKAITCFFNHMNDLLTGKHTPQGMSPSPPTEKTAPPAARDMDGSRLTKKEVIDIIWEMRDRRCTFGEIAVELKNRGIPTFSGRGEWHAQTIHRLCRK